MNKIKEAYMPNRLEKYDKKLKEIEVYKQHKHTLPFVGIKYGKVKKLLLVAESPGLDVEDDDTTKRAVEETQKNWYAIPDSKLTKKQKLYTNIIQTFEDLTDGKERGVLTYKNIKNAVIETGFDPSSQNEFEVFKYIAFTNFFQRPSLMKDGKHIKNFKNEDAEKANETLKEVIKILKPDYIFFLSKLAWKKYDEKLFDSKQTGHSCHPAIPWNKKDI